MGLASILGHRELAKRLLAELTTRPSHAYLFSGPRGVGKALTATALAHALLCERSPGADFCCTPDHCPTRAAAAASARTARGTAASAPSCECCSACAQIAAGVHPDFTRIGRAANRTDVLIEQVRELIGQLGIKPSRAPRRIAIIDDGETLNEAGQNALLKTLEEPPGHTIIFVITASERALLDTVRSRMRIVHFGALPVADLEAILAAHGLTDQARAGAIARLARGSAGRALALVEGGAPPMKELLDALLHARKLDFVGAQRIAQEFFGNREQAADNFELLARLLEDILCYQLLGPDSVPAAPETAKATAELARGAERLALVSCLEGAVRSREAIDEMANSRLQAEQWWMSAAASLRGE